VHCCFGKPLIFYRKRGERGKKEKGFRYRKLKTSDCGGDMISGALASGPDVLTVSLERPEKGGSGI